MMKDGQELIDAFHNDLEVRNHVQPLAQFLNDLLKDNAPYVVNKFVDDENLSEVEFPYYEYATDGAENVKNFQVLREYNDCIKECLDAVLSIKAQTYGLNGYAIYVNDDDFWTMYKGESITDILQRLAPEGDFEMNSCYVRENVQLNFESFGDAVGFAYTVADEAEQTLDGMLKFVTRLKKEERAKLPHTIHFLNTLEQQAGQIEQWTY